jgi:hyperosmotically inducible protein
MTTTRILLSAAIALAFSCGQGPRQETSDVAVTEEVTNRFERDTELTSFDLQVTTQDGVVTLTGRVDEEWQRNDAARITYEVPGVKQVVNRVVAEPAVRGSMEEEAS